MDRSSYEREGRTEPAPGTARPDPSAPAKRTEAPGLPRFLPSVAGPDALRPRAGLRLQRVPAEHQGVTPDPAPTEEAAEGATRPVPGLIVGDRNRDPEPGQMRKSEFLALLRARVCATAESALAGTFWSSLGCPYIDKWFDYYAGRSPEQIEKALVRYVPAAAGATDAATYVSLAAARVRGAIEEWAESDEGEGGQGEAEAGGAAGDGGLLSRVTSLFFKRRDGRGSGPESNATPTGVRRSLGPGRPLESGTRARMSRVFGRDLSHVRVHDDGAAERATRGLDARALTVGSDVAFGRGEYRPGTPVGDALLAHELAHVVQQDAPPGPDIPGSGETADLEAEADRAAADVVVSLWGGEGVTGIRHVLSSLGAGLRIQRCKAGKSARQKEIERLGKLQWGYFEKKRKEKEAALKKKAEEDAKKKGLPPPKKAPKVSTSEIIEDEVKKGAFKKKSPTHAWTKLSRKDQARWKKDAANAWAAVKKQVKGTELESVMKGVSYTFEPETALKNGWYAWQSGNKLAFGMSWVKNAKADPRNVLPNIAHELGGHREYGTTYVSEIMDAMLKHVPKSQRKDWKPGGKLRQGFFETFGYTETEIYSELRERRYSKPKSGYKPTTGGDKPEADIPAQLKKIKSRLDPQVAKAVVKELRKRIQKSSEILDRDKKFFDEQVKKIFGSIP